MLDYAANALSHWKVETIRARFESECGGRDPQDVIVAAIGDGTDVDDFWKRVETNPAAGRLRLMFVADSIPSELRAIVEFLNQRMSQVDVLGLELKQYVDDDAQHQTLVPRLIGETEAARQAKGRRERMTWGRESWLAAYREARGEREALIVQNSSIGPINMTRLSLSASGAPRVQERRCSPTACWWPSRCTPASQTATSRSLSAPSRQLHHSTLLRRGRRFSGG